MRSILVTLIILTPLPAVLVKPHYGLLLFSLVSYMVPHRLTWGFAYDFPFALVVGTVTLFAWLISREPKRLPRTTATSLLILLLLWCSTTTYFALVPELALAKWEEVTKVLVGTLLVLAMMGTRDRLHALVWVMVISLGFYGVKGGLFALLTAGRFLVLGPPGSYIMDNNSLAVALTMALPLMGYLWLHTNAKWIRIGLLCAMALTLLAILTTYSRGGFLALSALVLVLCIRSRRKLLTVMALSLMLVASLSFVPDKWFERMGTISTYEEDRSATGRLDAWRHGLNVTADRPVLGGGFGSFSGQVYAIYSPDLDARAAHSIYFEMLGEQGLVGLTLFLLLGFVSLRSGSWVIRSAQGRPDLKWATDLSAMLQLSFVGYAVGGAFLSIAYYELYYGMVAIMALTRWVVAKELQQTSDAAPAAGKSPAARGRGEFSWGKRRPAMPRGYPHGTRR